MWGGPRSLFDGSVSSNFSLVLNLILGVKLNDVLICEIFLVLDGYLELLRMHFNT